MWGDEGEAPSFLIPEKGVHVGYFLRNRQTGLLKERCPCPMRGALNEGEHAEIRRLWSRLHLTTDGYSRTGPAVYSPRFI